MVSARLGGAVWCAGTMGLIHKDLPAPPVWPPPLEREAVLATLSYARERDPIGQRVHLAFALFFMASIPFMTALSSISYALLVGYSLLRLPNIWRCYPPLLRIGTFWTLCAFTAWLGVSCLWSEAPFQGLDELKAARVILIPMALWPVLERLTWLMIATLLGVVAQNGSQLLQFLNLLDEPSELKGRFRGLLDGQTAMWCLAAMCWQLSAALRTKGRWRWLSLIGLLMATAGLIATGNRGPWIGAAIIMPLAMIVIAIRRPQARGFALALVVVGLIGSAASWPIARRMVLPRLEKAVSEVRAAREDGVYWTSGGLRIGLWKWAVDAWRTAPIHGVGAGGFRNAAIKNPDFQRAYATQQIVAPNSEKIDRDHAHNTYLQTLATTGLIGTMLFLIMIVLLLRQIVLDPDDHPHADGTLFALLAWLIAANFDCYTLNGHLYGLLMIMTAITLPNRPSTGSGEHHPELVRDDVEELTEAS